MPHSGFFVIVQPIFFRPFAFFVGRFFKLPLPPFSLSASVKSVRTIAL